MCAFLLSQAGAIAQQNPTDREKAIAHYNQGEAYFKAGAYEQAAAEYEKAYALEAQPGLLFNIGLAWENAGETQKAFDSYLKYIEAAPNGNKSTEARARSAALKKALNEATVRRLAIEKHRNKANEFLADKLYLQAVTELRALHKLQGDNGALFEIAVAFENAGENDLALAEYTRYIETGHPNHTAEATKRRRELKEKMNKKPDPNGNGNGNVVTPPPPPVDRPSILWPLAGSGATAVILGVAVASGLHASNLESDLNSNIDNRNPPLDNSDPRIDQGRSAAVISTGAFIAGAAAAGVTAYLWYRYFSSGKEANTVVAPTSNGVTLQGRF